MTTNGSLSDSLASTDGHRTPNVELLSKTNLYIKGLQPATTDQDLYEMCKRYGQISSTKAILDKATGSCRGYGFVEFTTPHFAEIAVQELIKSGIQAQMARISSVYPSHRHNQHHHHNNNNNHHSSNHHNNGNNHNNIGSGGGGASGHSSSNSGYNNNNNNNSHQHNQNSLNNSNPDPTNLYIANLPPNMSEQELENLLSNYGPVVSTRILRDQLSDISRGVGFARMESRDKCEKIIEQLNGRPYKDFKEPLLVKFADSGNRKRHHNNQQQHLNNNHHLHHKNHQDDNRWRESGNQVDVGGVPNFEHQSNISHSNHLSDLAMMSTMSYPRIPGFPPAMAAGAAYPTPQGSNAGAAYQAPLGPNPGAAYPASLGPNTGAPQWIPGPPGQPYVIPQQLIQAGGLDPSNPAAAAAAAALHYGHIPQLAYSPGYLGTYFVGPSARQSPQ